MDLDRLIAAAPDLRLETARLWLRRLTEADLPAALSQEQDRSVMRWIRDPEPIEKLEARVRSGLDAWRGAEGQWLVLAVQPRQATETIGIVCCRVTVTENETMEIGFRLRSDVHRRGFGFEASSALVDFLCDDLGVRKLVATCVADNEPSWRLLEKLGMTREARLREHSPLGGGWPDELVYGLLARERRALGAAGRTGSGGRSADG